MVKIQGVDPIVVERLRDRTRKTFIYETDQSRIIDDKKDEPKEQKKYRYPKKTLESSIDKLNKLLEEVDAPVRFVKKLLNDELIIQVIEIETQKAVATVPPEKIHTLIRNIDDPKGFIIDDSI